MQQDKTQVLTTLTRNRPQFVLSSHTVRSVKHFMLILAFFLFHSRKMWLLYLVAMVFLPTNLMANHPGNISTSLLSALQCLNLTQSLFTPSIPEIIWVKNVRAILVCGFLMKFLKKTYPENLKKIMGAVWELPAKQHSQSSPFSIKLLKPKWHL